MSDLIQLVYASKSKLPPSSQEVGVEPGIARILTQSRRNNTPQEIGGVLCYGNGFFFQCLEGDREAVEALYQRICQDDRHEQVTLLRSRPVAKRYFNQWAMKYLMLDRRVNAELKRLGLDEFKPLQFNDDCIDHLLPRLKEAIEVHRQSGGAEPKAGVVRDQAVEDPDKMPLLILGAGALVFGTAAALMLGFAFF